MPKLQIYGARVYCLGKCSPPAGCEGRSATRSSHSFCLTGELLSPARSDVPKKNSQGAESRIPHSMPIPSLLREPVARRHSETKSAIDPEFSPYTSRKHNFLPINFGPASRSVGFYLQLEQRSVSDRAFSRLKDFPWAIGCKSIGKFKREV